MLYLSNETFRASSGLFIRIILNNTDSNESFPILTIPWSDEAISIVQSADFWYAGTWDLILCQLQLLIEASADRYGGTWDALTDQVLHVKAFADREVS